MAIGWRADGESPLPLRRDPRDSQGLRLVGNQSHASSGNERRRKRRAVEERRVNWSSKHRGDVAAGGSPRARRAGLRSALLSVDSLRVEARTKALLLLYAVANAFGRGSIAAEAEEEDAVITRAAWPAPPHARSGINFSTGPVFATDGLKAVRYVGGGSRARPTFPSRRSASPRVTPDPRMEIQPRRSRWTVEGSRSARVRSREDRLV